MSKVISLTELTITYHHQLRASQVENVLPGQRVYLKVLQAVELGLDYGPVTPVDGSLAPGLLDIGSRVPGPVAGQQEEEEEWMLTGTLSLSSGLHEHSNCCEAGRLWPAGAL